MARLVPYYGSRASSLPGFAALLLGGALPQSAAAQSLAIAPVTLSLAPAQRASSLTITNTATVETAVQIRPFIWRQSAEEQLTPADDVVVSPPIVTIPPHGSQIVRILVHHAPSATELSYRLLVDTLPQPIAPGTVQLALRISLPVFIEPAGSAAARLEARIASNAGKPVLILENGGGRHTKLQHLALRHDSGPSAAVEGGSQLYLLAGATRTLPLPAQLERPATAKPYRLTAQSIDGPIDLVVANSDAR